MHSTKRSTTAPPMISGRLPVLGHVVAFMRDREALLRRGFAEQGEVFAIDLAGQKAAVVSGAQHNRTFYAATDHELNVEKMYTAVAAAIGQVLFLAPHETYVNQRPLLNAYFGRERMPGYLKAMNGEVTRWLDTLPQSTELEINEAMLSLTQHVAARAFVGPNFRRELDAAFWNDYQHIARSIDLVLPPNLPLPKFFRRDQARKRIRKTIAMTIARRRNNPELYDDMILQTLQVRQKDGSFMEDETIVSMLMGVLFAGHETTAGQVAWLLITLARRPEVLTRIRQEVRTHAATGELTAESLRQLKFLYLSIDEVTRLYPSADMQGRVVEHDINFGPYTVPAGWRVFVNAAVSHHLPGEFTNAAEFEPTRVERGEGKSVWSNVGFGGGTHKCTGMNFARHEMAVIVAHLVRDFELHAVTPHTRVVKGLGANRPSPTHLRFTRRMTGN